MKQDQCNVWECVMETGRNETEGGARDAVSDVVCYGCCLTSGTSRTGTDDMSANVSLVLCLIRHTTEVRQHKLPSLRLLAKQTTPQRSAISTS
eukprot:1739377-Rhodomonas_salina.1